MNLNVPELQPLTEEEYEILKIESEIQKQKIEEARIIAEYLKTKVDDSEDEVYTADKDLAKKMYWYQYKHDLWITDEILKYASFPKRNL